MTPVRDLDEPGNRKGGSKPFCPEPGQPEARRRTRRSSRFGRDNQEHDQHRRDRRQHGRQQRPFADDRRQESDACRQSEGYSKEKQGVTWFRCHLAGLRNAVGPPGPARAAARWRFPIDYRQLNRDSIGLASHIFCADKGDFYEIADGLPQYPKGSPGILVAE